MARYRRSFLSKAWRVTWRVLLLLVLCLLVLRFVPPPTTAFMLQSDYPVSQNWISIDELPPYVPLAVVAAEDQRFPDHFGVDFLEVSNAISKVLSQQGDGDGMRGASTITQQTAKNLFLWPGRSLLRKGLEAGLAVGLEALWGKKRILEVYLNVAEFGKGIYGVEAASQYYFGQSARYITNNQAARLAIILPSPRTRDPQDLTAYLRKRVAWVERQMRQLGPDYLTPILDN
ncbi:monofunctional biosynthetic peptidoglycan transglycosylase [Marinomonas transparens]|uniref:Biosynthetic peptidoglycan transglycosylase n=1 Tax=Marinomonas transparens TaxID=2795388 RepID=A0A934JLB5_9GAMM|nr:monofunctional biosynthetic peptidoglycan transglycosylase [Marinomonas transparens]MBJ7536174.1 monofunctional biosynthetic peptidoglycan transglycosylase [Marinomonas transparens]